MISIQMYRVSRITGYRWPPDGNDALNVTSKRMLISLGKNGGSCNPKYTNQRDYVTPDNRHSI